MGITEKIAVIVILALIVTVGSTVWGSMCLKSTMMNEAKKTLNHDSTQEEACDAVKFKRRDIVFAFIAPVIVSCIFFVPLVMTVWEYW